MRYNFNKQFAPDVESGIKRQTIRKKGKRRPPKIGEPLQLYTGMRTKYCRLLARETCLNVSEIKIIPAHGEVLIKRACHTEWFIVDSDNSLAILAKLDGFKSVDEFFEWFEKQLDGESGIFEGYLIEW